MRGIAGLPTCHSKVPPVINLLTTDRGVVFGFSFFVLASSCVCGAEPDANRADERLRSEMSVQLAVEFVDAAAVHWQNKHRCMTCHTNGVYLITRADVGVDAPAYRETRQFAREYLKQFVGEGDEPTGSRGEVQGVVATASFLAISDVKTLGKFGTFYPTRARSHLDATKRRWFVERLAQMPLGALRSGRSFRRNTRCTRGWHVARLSRHSGSQGRNGKTHWLRQTTSTNKRAPKSNDVVGFSICR